MVNTGVYCDTLINMCLTPRFPRKWLSVMSYLTRVCRNYFNFNPVFPDFSYITRFHNSINSTYMLSGNFRIHGYTPLERLTELIERTAYWPGHTLLWRLLCL